VSTLYRDGAFTDARSDQLRLGVSVLVTDGRIAWIRPADDEGELPAGCEIVDAGGATIVPGMVDGHSHLTLPGGSHWIDRTSDPTDRLLAVAEANGELQHRSGVRWARDVGAPTRPAGGAERALSLGIRDRWLGQLDDGADFVKLYMDGPDAGTPPFSADEVARVVAAVHARGRKVTAHATGLSGTRACAAAGVDSIEHGFELDADIAASMAASGCVLVTTMTVLKSWLTFGTTTAMPRFTGRTTEIGETLETAMASVRLAQAAGVAIVGGTDFGGGSARANQLPWEIECLVQAGLEPWQALASVTWRGGELLGEPDAGVIREGGPADFSLVHGDPCTDPTALWRIWRVA
jgi:imidazolonepropionase-like amidohydrolase